MTVFALAEQPVAYGYPPAAASSAFQEFIEQASGSGQYLIDITAYRGGETRSGGLWTLTEGPVAAVPGGVAVSAQTVALRYADRHWMGAPDDASQPNVYYEGRATVPLLMDREMPLLPETERRVHLQFGTIELANGDGELDSVVQAMAVDGRDVTVRLGAYMGAYAEFAIVAAAVGTTWEADDLTVRIGLRDRSYVLDRPLQTNLYAGSGGAEGGADLEGKPKPLLFGKCRNVTLIALDSANLIYHWHDGQSQAVDAVYDRGATLTPSGTDVANYAALAAQSVSAGEYATCLAESMVKLGSSPDGLVTGDLRGDADPDYADTLDVIALRVLRDRAGLSVSYLNTATFAAAGVAGGVVGFYIAPDEVVTTADVLDQLMASVGGWWGAARDGRIRAGRLSAPENRTPNLYLNEYDILSLDPEDAPVPRWRQRVGYQRNWTVQLTDIASAVTDARRQFLAAPQRVVSSSSGAVKLRHLNALDPDPLQTLYDSDSDAQALADYLLALHSPDRRIFRVAVKRLGYRVDLNSFVHVTWPRLGLSSGKKFAVIGIREEADLTVLRLWG